VGTKIGGDDVGGCDVVMGDAVGELVM